MTAERRGFVQSRAFLPEQSILGVDVLVELWNIAEEGIIRGEKFDIGFTRTIDEHNQPESVLVTVYDTQKDEMVAEFDIDCLGEDNPTYPFGKIEGIPYFERLEDLSPGEKEIYRERGRQVLEFVKQCKAAASKPLQS